MKVDKIHKHIEFLVQEDWIVERDDEDDIMELEEWDSALEDMYNRASQDVDALYAFLRYVTDSANMSEYEWDPEELSEKFNGEFRGGDTDLKRLLRAYFEDDDHGTELAPIAKDRHLADYFAWDQYVKDQRPDLCIEWRGTYAYLFEGE